MLLSIRHRTELRYSEPIAETVMELRMTPRADGNQALQGLRIDVGPSVPLFEHRDWLGNRVHQFSILPQHERVVIVAQSAVATRPNPADPAQLADALPVAAPLEHADYVRFGGLVGDDPRLEDLARRLGLGADDTAGTALMKVVSRLRDHFEYRKGVTQSTTTLAHALDQGGGVCQDVTHVALGLLRRIGIPARYVSGYLFRKGDGSELETHAFCEAFLPSFGWVAADPTHRGLAGEGHVTVAYGRDFADVPPNRGVYRGGAKETIAVQVGIESVGELPEGLLVPRATDVSVPTFEGAARVHREQLDYQQEQQQQQ